LEVCKNLDNAGIPKHLISKLVCGEAKDKFGVSEQYLRRLIPDEYKNQAQREIRYHTLRKDVDIRAGETKVSPGKFLLPSTSQTIGISKKEDITLESPISVSEHNSDLASPVIHSSTDKPSGIDNEDLKGLDLTKLPEQFRPYIVKLIKENKALKTSNARYRQQNNDLKFEDNFKQQVIDKLTKQNKQFKKDFADNYASKYSQLQAKIDQVESDNASFRYMLVGLEGISDSEISDEMRLDTINSFIKRHYDRIAEQYRIHKEEEAIIQAQNLESWK
jgi:hypothetical protein